MSADTVLKQIKDLNEGLIEVATPEVMAVHKFNPLPLTIAQIRECVTKNPDHPQAASFNKAVKKMPDTSKVVVDRISMECLLENKELQTVEEEQDYQGITRTVVCHKVGPTLGSKPAKPKPSPAKTS